MTLKVTAARVRVIWESITTSFWFIPVLMMLVSLALCYSCLSLLDRAILPDAIRPLMPMVTSTGVQTLVSTVATAMITATSIAFSMTLVALTLASNQFGPRLIRNFMDDKSTQSVLGILVSTFLFCLLSLHHLSSIASNQDAISLLAGVTVFFAIIDCITIVYFIHHVSTSIQADQVIARCFNAFCDDIDNLLPKPESNEQYTPVSDSWVSGNENFLVSISAKQSGYVQTINYESFIGLSQIKISGCEIHVRSGDHVLSGEEIITLYCKQPYKEEDFDGLRDAIVLGSSRTPIQDPEFAISQLVEIALRALSPGINDPHTAITCIDKLTAASVLMCSREFPSNTLLNKGTEVWVKRRTFTFDSVIDTAYSQIRQAAQDHVAVLIHLLNNLGKLRHRCDAISQAAVNKHALSIYSHIQSLKLCEQDSYALETAMLPFKEN